MKLVAILLALTACTARDAAQAPPRATVVQTVRGPVGPRGLPGPIGPTWNFAEHVYTKTHEVPVPRGTSVESTTGCDNSDIAISGGCELDFGGSIRASAPAATGWRCHVRGTDVVTYNDSTLTVTVFCLRRE